MDRNVMVKKTRFLKLWRLFITIVYADERGVTPGIESDGNLTLHCPKFSLCSISGDTPRLSALPIVIILIIIMIIKPHHATLHATPRYAN